MAVISRLRQAVLVVGAATALLLAGCGGDGGDQTGQAANGKVTIEWWHIQNQDPMKGEWAKLAKAYEAQHKNVDIKITTLENQAFKAKLTTVTQAGTPPDLFQTWGGGVLKDQLDAGLVKDISEDVAPWLDTLTPASVAPYQFDGKTYGVPYDIGMVGFWYNKKLFAQAGITQPPTTWTEYLDAVRKLKAAGITPIALAGKEKWPGHYYWAYLAMRVAGLDALKQAAEDRNFNTPDFIKAGQHVKELADLDPFQKGYLGTAYGTTSGEAAIIGNGQAAMELMGQWAPGAHAENAKNKKGLGKDLGFFTFPAVEGGKGSPNDVFGGGGGFAVGKDAPAEAVDFLKFISSVENQRHLAAPPINGVLPVTKGAEDALTDPGRKVIADTLAQASGFQLYLDQAYPPEVGSTVNDAVAALIAGQKSPEDVAKDITTAAQNN
jgi:raffinose/stachyose/melibiose transport system substrate-binding protein